MTGFNAWPRIVAGLDLTTGKYWKLNELTPGILFKEKRHSDTTVWNCEVEGLGNSEYA